MSDGASFLSPQEGDEMFVITFFSEDDGNGFPLLGKYSCSDLDPILEDPYLVETPSTLKMQFAGVKCDLLTFINDDDILGNVIISGSAYIDGDATNATIIFEVTFDDNTTGNFYYEGPITFMSED